MITNPELLIWEKTTPRVEKEFWKAPWRLRQGIAKIELFRCEPSENNLRVTIQRDLELGLAED